MKNKNNSNIVVMAQLNPITGDVEYNKNKAIDFIKRADEMNADLIVFPELFLLGYPIGDILGRYPYLADQCQKALDEIKTNVKNTSVLIGFAEKNNQNFSKPFYNSAAFIRNQKIEKIIRKSLLANYAEHNDYRYFEGAEVDNNSRIIEINGIKYGVLICEDSWNDADFFEKKLYKIDPVAQIAPHADVLICLSASCSRTKKEQLKHNMIKHITNKYNVKYIYVNQVGSNDELVYGGVSRFYSEEGKILACAKSFEEDFLNFDIEKGGRIEPYNFEIEAKNEKKEFSLNYENDLKRTYQAIICAIRDYFSKNGFKRAVLGLSGGLDSTICAVLLADALGKENVLGISMPSKLTSKESKNDALELSKNLGINFMEIPIKDMQDTISNKFDGLFSEISKKWEGRFQNSFTQDNIQARSRAMILWGAANEFSCALPIATSDKSELYMGYATINGDMSGGYAPICDVVKTKLFALARWMNENRKMKNAIPQSIIEKPPGAELAINPKTGKTLLAEDALMPYEFLDEAIYRIENLNQSFEQMLQSRFLYEKNNIISKKIKEEWLNKFFKKLNTALYKWYIVPPGPIIDSRSINKAEFKQPIVSNIKY